MSEFTRRQLLAGAGAGLVWQRRMPAAPLRDRKLLAGSWTPESLERTLVPRDRWRPYPTFGERAAWSALPGEVRETISSAAAREFGKPYSALPASLILEYVRTGNRSHFEAAQFGRRAHLRNAVLAECVEGSGRFLDEIVDGIWATCEETFWGVPAHIAAQERGAGLPDVSEPIIDLFAAETGALLSWTDFLLGDKLDVANKLVRARIAHELERRILRPYWERNDFWWMGLDPNQPHREMNNWNPWINSNCLACALLMDDDPKRRAATVYKVLRSVDRFLDSYHDDGGCDEGPSYWSRAGGSLFDNLELLRSASDGAINIYASPLIKDIGRYIFRANIAEDWFVNFADASAKVNLDGDLVYRYGRAIQDSDLSNLGAYALRGNFRLPDSLGRSLPAIFNFESPRKVAARQPLVRDVWMPGTQVAAARVKKGSSAGFYFAALGGHNAESHNHNDVGNVVIFYNGRPVLIDIGVETYTARTFSSQRYGIWTMQSGYHNLPTINGVMQKAGREYEARDVSFTSDDQAAEFRANISAAYPSEAGVERWDRVVRLDRVGGGLSISDNFVMRSDQSRVELSLISASPVRKDTDLSIELSGGLLQNALVRLSITSPETPDIRSEEIKIADSRLASVWGDRIHRTVLAWSSLPKRGQIKLELRDR